MMKIVATAFKELAEAVKASFSACMHLYKIMIPVIIAVKLLQELDLIRYLAAPLAPAMHLVGLPPEMGLAWATAIVNNLYSAIIVMLQLWPDCPLTQAQTTVLATMMLVAHGLPVELKIAQKAGSRLPFQALVRLGGALALGVILHHVYQATGALQGPTELLIDPGVAMETTDEPLHIWAMGQVKNLVGIYFIVLALMVLLKILKAVRVTDLADKVLRPVLSLMGIGPKASAITVIGLTMGISYGGGLIIVEAKSGRVDKKNVFYALTLMGLSHSLIEDTLLFVMVGADLGGILYGRAIFSIIAVAAIVRMARALPQATADKYLWSDPK